MTTMTVPVTDYVRRQKLFSDKEANWLWSRKLWEWGLEACLEKDLSHLVQIQDDVTVAGLAFWPALTAMVKTCPDQVIGLQGAHPAFRELSRDGHRWAKSSPAWLVGVAYVIPRAILKELVEWRAKIPQDFAAAMNEDDLLGHWLTITGRCAMHPIPTIVDHDTAVASTYGNENHLHRRPTVTWKDFGAKEIEDVAFWRVPAEVPLVSNPHLDGCWGCHKEPQVAAFSTGMRIGRRCLAGVVSAVIAPNVPIAKETLK